MARRRSSGYRGRPWLKDALRLILTLLILLLTLLAAGLMIGQRYIVYTDDGIRLELPFFRREPTPASDLSVSVDVVQLPQQPKPLPDPQPESAPPADPTVQVPPSDLMPE